MAKKDGEKTSKMTQFFYGVAEKLFRGKQKSEEQEAEPYFGE